MSEMHTGTRHTSIGLVSISESDGCIVSMRIGDSDGNYENDVICEAFGQLEEYLSGERKRFEMDLRPRGTDFQKDVWSALCKIPYGRTVSYSELAVSSGHPGACRAVGNANGKNPIPILIPCLRVIRTSGDMGGYSLGIDMKRKLLELERSL